MNSSAKKKIQNALSIVPIIYANHRQTQSCKEFLEHHEWKLALESLIELDNETEYTFPKEFWKQLEEAADRMFIKDVSQYCKLKAADNSA